jgi:hypothetical protein
MVVEFPLGVSGARGDRRPERAPEVPNGGGINCHHRGIAKVGLVRQIMGSFAVLCLVIKMARRGFADEDEPGSHGELRSGARSALVAAGIKESYEKR